MLSVTTAFTGRPVQSQSSSLRTMKSSAHTIRASRSSTAKSSCALRSIPGTVCAAALQQRMILNTLKSNLFPRPTTATWSFSPKKSTGNTSVWSVPSRFTAAEPEKNSISGVPIPPTSATGATQNWFSRHSTASNSWNVNFPPGTATGTRSIMQGSCFWI